MALCKLLHSLTFLSLLFAESHAQLNVCGIAPLNPKIVGGQSASPGSWPWQVSLRRSGGHFCGGSLINKYWVLSAAHCFVGTRPSSLQVSLGQHQLQGGITDTQVILGVDEIFVNPGFNRNNLDNDIALLRLSSPVDFTDYIRPVCLAAGNSVFNNGTTSWVTGWGNVFQGVPLPPPQALQEVKVPIIGNRQCNCLYSSGMITENMICSGVLSGGKDSCQGDSGGPMVNKQRARWIQSGIVSFGEGCAKPNRPGVYARVSRYQSWINSIIQDDKPGFIRFTSSGGDPDKAFVCRRLPLLPK